MARIQLKDYLKTNHKSYVSHKIERADFIKYLKNIKIAYAQILEAIKNNATEENIKNIVVNFIKDTFYADRKDIQINSFERIDYAIKKNDNIEVIMEFKKPSNTAEMITYDNLNKKALHEAILYFYEEKHKVNYHIKNIIISDGLSYYIFNPSQFQHKSLEKICYDSIRGDLYLQNTKEIYKAIADIISRENLTFEFAWFDLRYLEKRIKNFDLNNVDIKDKAIRTLLYVYKLFHPDFLLNEYSPKDSNQLNKKFYDELLYILGLEEVSENSKKLIKPIVNGHGLINETINQLEEQKDISGEAAVNIAFELIITWLNRILFLKLFESQLVDFNDDKNFKFITSDKITDFDELNKLFFSILGKKIEDRNDEEATINIPYLNSSLFEKSDMELKYINITALNNNCKIGLYKSSNLRHWAEYKNKTEERLLKYLLDFLESYDFSSGTNDNLITEENRDIINSAVLGLIFEKLNGYKDGSFYTPGFITEYMAKECIEKAVVDKFNSTFEISAANIREIKNYIGNIYSKDIAQKYNDVINSLRICDPAVGSGHFLVSVLNHIIYLKSYLGILFDDEGNKINNTIEIFDDTLVVFNQNDVPYAYKRKDRTTHQIQKALFKEKRTIIENCLFAVDINPKSVYICQLRLWIELLKNTYYIDNSNDMEVLPNIDINIKTGNSLVSKYSVQVGKAIVQQGSKEQKENIKAYKLLVAEYKRTGDKNKKKEINLKLAEIKKKLYSVVENVLVAETKEQKDINKQLKKLEVLKKRAKTINEREKFDEQINKLRKNTKLLVLGDSFDDPIYKNSMEWMLEFPEMLDEDGKFQGFDVVIGNPPYIDSETMVLNGMQPEREYILKHYSFAKGNWDIYIPFFNLAFNLIKSTGCMSYISPDKWLAKPFGAEMRCFLMGYIYKILRAGHSVFDSATVDSILSFISKQKSNYIEASHFTSKKEIVCNTVCKSKVDPIQPIDFIFSKYINLLEKLSANSSISDAYNLKAENACATSDAYLLQNILEDNKYFDEDTMLKFINTGTIDKYTNKWGRKPTTYLKKHYECPVVFKSEFNKVFKNSYNSKSYAPKLIIKGLTLLDACIDVCGNIIPGKSTIIICNNDEQKLKIISAIINSKISTFYLKEKNLSSSYCGGISYTPDMINSIPCPNLSEEDKNDILLLVEKILEIKNSNNYKDQDMISIVVNLQSKLDALFYKLYNLTEEEIKIIEENV